MDGLLHDDFLAGANEPCAFLANPVVTVSVGSYFAEGIETEEQLEAALDGIREECSKLIGAGKKVIVQ